MRAREITEGRTGTVRNNLKPRKDQEMAIPAAHRVAGTADRVYDLNRVMMAVAASDGKAESSVPDQSWCGRNNIAAPYTKLESEMLKRAYRSVGVEWDDALKPNPQEKSLELSDINNRSPVPTRKTNKYGV
jgi:hypothetical protein